MSNSAPTRSTFVLRVWIEQSDPDGANAQWRGQITQFPSGDQRYVSNVGEVAQFIRGHLQSIGVRQPGIFHKLMTRIGSRRAARAERDHE